MSKHDELKGKTCKLNMMRSGVTHATYPSFLKCTH